MTFSLLWSSYHASRMQAQDAIQEANRITHIPVYLSTSRTGTLPLCVHTLAELKAKSSHLSPVYLKHIDSVITCIECQRVKQEALCNGIRFIEA